MASGLTAANVTITQSASTRDLIITDGVSGDEIYVGYQNQTSSYEIETLVYGDDTSVSLVSGITVHAYTGTSSIDGSSGDDTLIGSTGMQTIWGEGGNDVFIAATGSTKVFGNSGNDVYSYVSGSGALTIDEAAGTDTIKLGAGLTAANVTLSESANGYDLLIKDGVSGDVITVIDQTYSTTPGVTQVETLVFGDGSSLSLTGNMILQATAGNTTLQTQNGNDTLIAAGDNSGTETLMGRTGNDVYSYDYGDGSVYIYDTGGTDTLRLRGGTTTAYDVIVTQTANTRDLIITDGNAGDEIYIAYQNQSSTYAVETLIFGDGTSASLVSGVTVHAYTGTSSLDGTAGNDTLIGSAGTQTIWGEGGNDVFIAATGSTKVFGNSGNDIYSYESGNGALVIDEAAGTDTIKLGTGLTAANVTLTETNGYDLIVKDGVSGDVITVIDQMYNATPNGYQVETLIFGDDSSLNLTGNVLLYATDGNTTLQTQNGNDTLIAASGNSGTETLLGRTGNDVYSYESGDGSVYIYDTGGTDTLKLGTGLNADNVFFSVSADGANLILTDGVSGDSITLSTEFNATYRVETLVFGDSSTLALSTVSRATTTTLNGTTGNDILIPNTANTTLAGKGGNDTYDFGRGMGNDYINNGVSTTNSAAGTLFFGHDIGDDQVWFDRVDDSGNISGSGDNLRVIIMGTDSSVTINDWYASGQNYSQLSEFALSDSGLQLDSQLSTLVAAMATFESNYYSTYASNFDPTDPGNSSISDSTVLAAVSSAWHS